MTNIIKLPGLIDTHVHLREPGNTHKENFETGTKAAIAGGYTMVIDMPNNPNPITNPEALDEKIKLAEGRIYSDLGFHFGGAESAVPYFEQVKNKVFGLKVYMNHTTGPLLIEDPEELDLIFSKWPKDKVLMVHAEQETLTKAIDLAKKHNNKLHVCHVARKLELELIMSAKEEGMNITCEVAMHHLYFTQEDEKTLGHYGMMRPPLASNEDQSFIWDNINSIDIIASDHAPHTKEEKMGETIVNGVPGLETSLPLLLQAMNDERITLNQVIQMTNTNPRKIFGIPEQPDTYVEVDIDEEWTIKNENLFTKCAWTPFDGMKIKGKIKKTILRGQTVFEDGKILGNPQGKVTYPTHS